MNNEPSLSLSQLLQPRWRLQAKNYERRVAAMKRFAFSLMIIGIAAFFCSGAVALPEDGLVLYFAFDGGSVIGDTAKDLSGNGNDATINGGARGGADGLEFDGADG
jgi:hypothetical protein